MLTPTEWARPSPNHGILVGASGLRYNGTLRIAAMQSVHVVVLVFRATLQAELAEIGENLIRCSRRRPQERSSGKFFHSIIRRVDSRCDGEDRPRHPYCRGPVAKPSATINLLLLSTFLIGLGAIFRSYFLHQSYQLESCGIDIVRDKPHSLGWECF
jgi:hypothetical protein